MRFSMPFQDQEGSREELCRLALGRGRHSFKPLPG
jgi:hypothetical protein